MQFDELVERMEPKIHMLLNQLHIYKNREEYYQIAFISLWQASQTYIAGKYDEQAYLYNQMRFDVIDALRKNRKIEERFVPAEQDILQRVMAQAKQPLRKLILEEILQQLTDEERRLTQQMFIEEWTNEQLAGAWQLSVEAIRKRKYRLKKKLAQLGEHYRNAC